MMRSIRQIALFVVISGIVAVLSGCFGDSKPAPVIDAWYQKGAASNFYVVQHDDTIYSIAFAFGLDYRDLVAANHLHPPYFLKSGERLKMTHRPSQRIYVGPPRTPIRTSVHAVVAHTIWQWPVKGRLIQTFSRLPSGHPGISIAGKLGEPVRAASSGMVVYSGDGVRGYGNLIIIKHNDSYLSAYAFNQQNLVNVGDRVKVGAVIAHMGKNNAGHALLYFEIRRDGAPVNPLPFLR